MSTVAWNFIFVRCNESCGWRLRHHHALDPSHRTNFKRPCSSCILQASCINLIKPPSAVWIGPLDFLGVLIKLTLIKDNLPLRTNPAAFLRKSPSSVNCSQFTEGFFRKLVMFKWSARRFTWLVFNSFPKNLATLEIAALVSWNQKRHLKTTERSEAQGIKLRFTENSRNFTSL